MGSLSRAGLQHKRESVGIRDLPVELLFEIAPNLVLEDLARNMDPTGHGCNAVPQALPYQHAA